MSEQTAILADSSPQSIEQPLLLDLSVGSQVGGTVLEQLIHRDTVYEQTVQHLDVHIDNAHDQLDVVLRNVSDADKQCLWEHTYGHRITQPMSAAAKKVESEYRRLSESSDRMHKNYSR